jgi:hypothetical protein
MCVSICCTPPISCLPSPDCYDLFRLIIHKNRIKTSACIHNIVLATVWNSKTVIFYHGGVTWGDSQKNRRILSQPQIFLCSSVPRAHRPTHLREQLRVGTTLTEISSSILPMYTHLPRRSTLVVLHGVNSMLRRSISWQCLPTVNNHFSRCGIYI